MGMLTIGRTDDGFLIADAGKDREDGQGYGLLGSDEELRTVLTTRYHLPGPKVEQAIRELKDPNSTTTIVL